MIYTNREYREFVGNMTTDQVAVSRIEKTTRAFLANAAGKSDPKAVAYMRPILVNLRRATESLIKYAKWHEYLSGRAHLVPIPLRTYKAWVRAFEKLHHADFHHREAVMRDGNADQERNKQWATFWSRCYTLYDIGFSETLTVDEALDQVRRRDPNASRASLISVREALRSVRGRKVL